MKKLHPVTILFLGAVPALAASTDVRAALGMSLAVLLVLLCSTLLLGILRRLIPAGAKLPAAVLTVAGFASMAQLLGNAFLPGPAAMLGLYLAALAVELLLFTSGEEALDEGLAPALGRAVLSAICFAVFVLVLAALREIFGSASFAGTEIAALKNVRIPLLAQPAGGLLLFAVLLAIVNRLFPGENVKGALTRAAVGLEPEDKEAEA
ncbi:MAG: Rnf-Nqr domain containing protein [Clostridia bacterium]